VLGTDLRLQLSVWEDDSRGDHAVVVLEDSRHLTVGTDAGEDVSSFVADLLAEGMSLVADVLNPSLPELSGWFVRGNGTQLTICPPEPPSLAVRATAIPEQWRAIADRSSRVLLFAGVELGLSRESAEFDRLTRAARSGCLVGGVVTFAQRS
jgi:hypothetical protein